MARGGANPTARFDEEKRVRARAHAYARQLDRAAGVADEWRVSEVAGAGWPGGCALHVA